MRHLIESRGIWIYKIIAYHIILITIQRRYEKEDNSIGPVTTSMGWADWRRPWKNQRNNKVSARRFFLYNARDMFNKRCEQHRMVQHIMGINLTIDNY